MKDRLSLLSVRLQLLKDESGQDLVEYGFVVAFIAFAATAGMSTFASDINSAFGHMGSTLTASLT